MHWADEIAQQLIEKHPEAEEFTCASGISPSGPVHMGNLREVVTTYFVVKALRDKGKKARQIFSWDNYDAFRKVPVGVPAEYSQYLGTPYTNVPDPFGCHANYAEHFEAPFKQALKEFGIEVEHIEQTDMYTSGKYAEGMIKALKNRKEIYDILYTFKTQEADPEQREKYYPIQIYCPQCGKNTTTVTSCGEDCEHLDYECKNCGYKGKMNMRTDFHAKLPWLTDWPMRWEFESVMFEPGGRDHSSQGGSISISPLIAKNVYNIEPPYYRGYEFVGIKGGESKISGSKGTAMTPENMLKVYPPEIILWMFTRFLPERGFNVATDSDVLKTYHEFDRMYQTYKAGEGDEVINRIMELALSCRPNIPEPYNAQHIAAFAPIVNFDLDLLVTLLNKIGENVTKEQISERFEKITHWLQNYCPEQIMKVLEAPNQEFYSGLSSEEQGWVEALRAAIEQKSYTLEEMQTLLYDIPKQNGEADKTRQKRFFEIVYNLLLGRDKGPRLYLFLQALEKSQILKLLSF